MSFGPFLASAALGFIKGLASKEQFQGLELERDLIGPAREEIAYRSRLGNAPVGTSAAIFAADHVRHDHRQAVANNQPGMTPLQVVARLGDVFLGGMLYEKSFKASGLAGSIASHMAQNLSISAGQRLRNGKKK